MREIYLFVQDGCRPCMYAETQLKKIDGWEEVVKIINSKTEDDSWSDFAKECGVVATPTLIGIEDGKVVATMAGSSNMTSDFWQSTINKHKS